MDSRPVIASLRCTRACSMKKAAHARAAGRARASWANQTSDPPATSKAAPISRMKWALSGPVLGTPGAIAYHAAGAASMNTPLAAAKRPSIQASLMRIASLLPTTDEMAIGSVTTKLRYQEQIANPYQESEACKAQS